MAHNLSSEKALESMLYRNPFRSHFRTDTVMALAGGVVAGLGYCIFPEDPSFSMTFEGVRTIAGPLVGLTGAWWGLPNLLSAFVQAGYNSSPPIITDSDTIFLREDGRGISEGYLNNPLSTDAMVVRVDPIDDLEQLEQRVYDMSSNYFFLNNVLVNGLL